MNKIDAINSPSVTSENPMNYFSMQLPFMLQHLLYGELVKGKYIGIHFFQEGLHQIREIINQPNEYGIWEAKINIRHHRTKAWGRKEKASTFFPLCWHQELMITKLEEAYSNRKKVYTYKYIGETTCGIQIAFLFRDRKVVSCFPIFKES
jgi:hypothetical protein